jgi:transcriptional regulator with XRE-family HTH domain
VQKKRVVAASPTAPRRRLGHELRRLRDAAGFRGDEVAARLSWSPTKLSRIETGQVSVHHGDVADLLDIYGVKDRALREYLATMARQSRAKGWWHRHRETLKRGFDSYIGLEAEAATLLTYQAQVVPGLLQTEEYARASIKAVALHSDDVDQKVAVRMSRQDLLTRDQPLSVHAILDEAVLRRVVSGSANMADQCAALLQRCELGNVTIQVLAFDAGAHAALDGGFNILGFPDEADPDIVYLEQAPSGLVLDGADELDRYTTMFRHLADQALPPGESLALISSLAEAYTQGATS